MAAGESLSHVIKRRLYGVLYLVIVIGLIALSIAIYNKAFVSTVDVKLQTDYTGNALALDSDVKERGIIVGSVKAVSVLTTTDPSTGKKSITGALVTLALSPSRVGDIPNNVSAQILPKTLFGQQYVSLIPPEDQSQWGSPIKAGATIAQDRSKSALEAQNVLGDLLPILQAVKPAELNATLTAVATALQGRGKELGQTLVHLDQVLRQYNPHTQKFVDDLKKLGQTADLYNSVAPQLFDTLQNLETTSKTVISQQAAINNLLSTATNTSVLLDSFLSENKARLINLVGSTDKVYRLLDEYSPEFDCMIGGLANLYDLANDAIYNHQIHLSAVIEQRSNLGYKPGEQPILITGKGPHCFGLPNNIQPVVDGKFQIPPEFRCLNDGAALTTDPCGQDKPSYASSRMLNSPEEDAIVNSLIAGQLHTTPDKVSPAATILTAPLLRGNTVAVK